MAGIVARRPRRSGQQARDHTAEDEAPEQPPERVHAAQDLVAGPDRECGRPDHVDPRPQVAGRDHEAQEERDEEHDQRQVRELTDRDLTGLPVAEEPFDDG
jgi:hypothetical protein